MELAKGTICSTSLSALPCKLAPKPFAKAFRLGGNTEERLSKFANAGKLVPRLLIF